MLFALPDGLQLHAITVGSQIITLIVWKATFIVSGSLPVTKRVNSELLAWQLCFEGVSCICKLTCFSSEMQFPAEAQLTLWADNSGVGAVMCIVRCLATPSTHAMAVLPPLPPPGCDNQNVSSISKTFFFFFLPVGAKFAPSGEAVGQNRINLGDLRDKGRD